MARPALALVDDAAQAGCQVVSRRTTARWFDIDDGPRRLCGFWRWCTPIRSPARSVTWLAVNRRASGLGRRPARNHPRLGLSLVPRPHFGGCRSGCRVSSCLISASSVRMVRRIEGIGVATDLGELQSRLWEAADQLRANSGLKASEYASPVLGLIFLRYADDRFAQAAETVGPGICSPADRTRGLPGRWRAVSARGVAIRDAPRVARGSRHWQSRQPGDGRDRGLQPRTSRCACRRTTPASPMTSWESYCDSCERSRTRSRAMDSA